MSEDMSYLDGKLRWKKVKPSDVLANGEIWVASLDSNVKAAITDAHAYVLADCYIDSDDLRVMAKLNETTCRAILSDQTLPDNPSIKSGDFGEILCRSALSGWREKPTFPLKKWRYRHTKNDTTRGTDLIGYSVKRKEPAPSDVLIVCEVKTRSASATSDIVKQAFEGVKNDYASRLANSLFFQQSKLIKEGRMEEAGQLARFRSRHKVSYVLRLVAGVVHEKTLWEDAFLGELPARHRLKAEVNAVVIIVDGLADWIDRVHVRAVELAKD